MGNNKSANICRRAVAHIPRYWDEQSMYFTLWWLSQICLVPMHTGMKQCKASTCQICLIPTHTGMKQCKNRQNLKLSIETAKLTNSKESASCRGILWRNWRWNLPWQQVICVVLNGQISECRRRHMNDSSRSNKFKPTTSGNTIHLIICRRWFDGRGCCVCPIRTICHNNFSCERILQSKIITSVDHFRTNKKWPLCCSALRIKI